MKRDQVSVEELFRLLPSLDELEDLRLSILAGSVPDPGKEWARSSAYSTFDKRIISRDALDDALAGAEQLVHERVREFFTNYSTVLQRFMAGDAEGTAEHLIRQGEVEEGSGRFARAQCLYELALSVALPLQDKRTQILALRRIARVLLSQGGLRESTLYYTRSGEIAELSGDLRGEVVARTGIGNVQAFEGRWAEAEAAYRSALDRIPEGDKETLALERAQLFNNLGMSCARQERREEAEAWFLDARELWSVLDVPADVAVCYHNLGLLRQDQGRPEEARALFKQALALPIPSVLHALIAVDLAESYARSGHASAAVEWGRVAESGAIAQRSPYALSHIYRGLGNLARLRGDEGGITFFEKSLEIARERSLRFVEAETLVDYAALRAQIGQKDEAVAYLDRAEEIFSELEPGCQRAWLAKARAELDSELPRAASSQ